MKQWAHGQVVPDGWAAHHRPIIAGFFCDTATVRRQTGTTTGPLGQTTPVWTDLTPPNGVPALMQTIHTTHDGHTDSAGHPIVVADYYCRLDVEWTPDPGDRILITASPDPANVGTYTVARLESQGHVVDRTIHCTRTSNLTD